MYHNFLFNNLNDSMPYLLNTIQQRGTRTESRAGVTKELMHVGITIEQPWKRELTLPGRKHNIAAQIAETMWVLSGNDDIRWLSRYLPRAKDFSDDGVTWRGAYGPRLRGWDGKLDQLQYCFELLSNNPLDRRAVAAIYDPVSDSKPGKDIPCNDFLNFSMRGDKLDLHVFVRSNDAWWGLSGINAFEWSALLEIMAGLLNCTIGSLHFSTTSLHLYEQHWAKADSLIIAANNEMKEGLQHTERFDASKLPVWDWGGFDVLVEQWFDVENAIRDGQQDDISMIENFPEPMLRDWLRVIHWWWNGHSEITKPLEGTRLYESMQMSLQPKLVQTLPIEVVGTPLADKINELHTEKDAAYGDSWRKRGETVGILANIARKVDRLEIGGSTSDETMLDTAIDLTVYLAKYRWWLAEEGIAGAPLEVADGTGHVEQVHLLLKAIEEDNKNVLDVPASDLIQVIVPEFNQLQRKVERFDDDRELDVNNLLEVAFLLARTIHNGK